MARAIRRRMTPFRPRPPEPEPAPTWLPLPPLSSGTVYDPSTRIGAGGIVQVGQYIRLPVAAGGAINTLATGIGVSWRLEDLLGRPVKWGDAFTVALRVRWDPATVPAGASELWVGCAIGAGAPVPTDAGGGGKGWPTATGRVRAFTHSSVSVASSDSEAVAVACPVETLPWLGSGEGVIVPGRCYGVDADGLATGGLATNTAAVAAVTGDVRLYLAAGVSATTGDVLSIDAAVDVLISPVLGWGDGL